jgi:hypothetical protein
LIFTVQTERVVEKDNTVAIKDRWWQIDKSIHHMNTSSRRRNCHA